MIDCEDEQWEQIIKVTTLVMLLMIKLKCLSNCERPKLHDFYRYIYLYYVLKKTNLFLVIYMW